MAPISALDIVNTALIIFVLAGITLLMVKLHSNSHLWEEIEAVKLRLRVQETLSPCRHCREQHMTPGSDGCAE